jgi:cell division protein FtsX
MVLFRQAQRAIHESYRFVVWNQKSTLCSILRLWLAYAAILVFWLLFTNLSRSAEEFVNTPTMTVVVRGNAPGIAVLGEQLAAVPEVTEVRYRLNDQIMSSLLNDPLPGTLPSFSVQTSTLNPDTLAMVASRIRRIDDVLNVVYSRERLERSGSLLAGLRLTTGGFGIVVVVFVFIVMGWEMHRFVEQRALVTRVMWRMGASRMFIAAPAAVVGGSKGFVASGLALWVGLRVHAVIADPLVVAEALTAPERAVFLIGGTLLGSFADFGATILTPTTGQSGK